VAGERHRRAVVAAAGHRQAREAAAQRVHGLGEGDAVLLRSRGVAALELEVELPEPVLALEVTRAAERGVADLGVDDLPVGLDALGD